ncbi:DUF2637 domain-containing protein [Streptomyces sp. NBC_00291]|uniref:DUF2637 domain-containing protein n=1 Tax=Streptomyces sp. NBC_00291 TaxID=2975704 RepID=UPI00225749F8|nr:DUF2637 domain-containing protein [Streptomyces sp. NBC_00291]MCX5153668.1 DUF2637 domain-containing protein [Streptomyces sp. NBC_00291]
MTTPTRTLITTAATERYVLAAAGCVIVALTAAAFWLSYAHLAEVAGQHGLASAPERQWAWPATLDAFIVAGELLMLRASLRRVSDWWAIALTAIGSLGSIALNVAGVTGTRGTTQVPLLDYVIAAVPPTAALLAFGALMRQIHQHVAEPVAPHPSQERSHPTEVSTQPPHNNGRAYGRQPEPTGDESLDPGGTGAEIALDPEPGEAPGKPAPPVVPSRRVGRPTTGDLDDFLVIVDKLEGEPTLKQMRQAIEAEDHSISNERLGMVKRELAELRRQQALTGSVPRH